jgi:hypothetical protein
MRRNLLPSEKYIYDPRIERGFRIEINRRISCISAQLTGVSFPLKNPRKTGWTSSSHVSPAGSAFDNGIGLG